MFQRKRLTVHRNCHQGVATVEHGHGEPTGVPVNGTANDLIGPGLESEFPEQVVQAHPQPPGIANELAPYFVGDTGESDVGLDQGPGQELFECQLGRPRHHPGHPEDVIPDLDARNLQGGVDAVEGCVRCDKRCQTLYPQIGPIG